MIRIIGFIRDGLFSYLPEMYRPASSPSESDLIGPCRTVCLAVAFSSQMVLFVSYFAFVDDVYEIMVAGPGILENPGMLWLGPVWFITFALRPINFVLFYLFIDGVFRAYFTLAGEVYGTFVLHAVGWIHL